MKPFDSGARAPRNWRQQDLFQHTLSLLITEQRWPRHNLFFCFHNGRYAIGPLSKIKRILLPNFLPLNMTILPSFIFLVLWKHLQFIMELDGNVFQ